MTAASIKVKLEPRIKLEQETNAMEFATTPQTRTAPLPANPPNNSTCLSTWPSSTASCHRSTSAHSPDNWQACST